jgi:hypothetical protein
MGPRSGTTLLRAGLGCHWYLIVVELSEESNDAEPEGKAPLYKAYQDSSTTRALIRHTILCPQVPHRLILHYHDSERKAQDEDRNLVLRASSWAPCQIIQSISRFFHHKSPYKTYHTFLQIIPSVIPVHLREVDSDRWDGATVRYNTP